jgi:hypothetical protein
MLRHNITRFFSTRIGPRPKGRSRLIYRDFPQGHQRHFGICCADIKTVQARMRHASATTTLDTYGHLSPDADESTRTGVRRGDRGGDENYCGLTAD